MESRVIARKAAGQLIAHRNSLAGKAEDAHQAHAALDTAAKTVERHHDDHRSGAAAATSHWDGRNAAGFDRRARRMTKALRTTSTASTKAAEIVGATAASLGSNHTAVANLVEEYTTKATRLLDAARGVTGAGAQGALVRAAGQVVDLARDYTNESIRHVRSVRGQMKDAAEALGKLERTVEHDGFADPTRRGRKHTGSKAKAAPPKTRSGVRNKIKKIARGQLGYHEGPGNQNKYGPTGAWCSNFATWVWKKSGVDIGILPFTGDVYHWGQEHGLAYGKHNLDAARPGDVLLFGTGPESTQTSTHIGIVESVHGDKVTLVEGNSSDKVQRVTHTLSSSTFYGGVHPR
ncbi:MAG: CHAP domain-containing protein [Actinophytocola sp.]|uniref:CHAP domain-containing protein n=1 Tax=Actinophytocola sp. TaxID=1872138 RepID=UPI001322DF47|nr:CHAP domain-containing protein [Actinophytocola sp.]MPZ85432.1 CHAP domain-containing protein [Actinophytocola sp.]